MKKYTLERVLYNRTYGEVIQMLTSGEVQQYDISNDYEINRLVAERLLCTPECVAAYRAVIAQRKWQEVKNCEELPKLVACF